MIFQRFLNSYQWHFQHDFTNIVDGATGINFDDSQAGSQIIVTDFDNASLDTDSGIRSVLSNAVSLPPGQTVRFAPDTISWCSEPIRLEHVGLRLVQRGRIGASLTNSDVELDHVPAHRIPMRQLGVNISTDNVDRPPVYADVIRRPRVPGHINGRPPVPLGLSISADDGRGQSFYIDHGRGPSAPSDIDVRPSVPIYVGGRPSVPVGIDGRLSISGDIDRGSFTSFDIDGRPSMPVDIGGRPSSGVSVTSRSPPFVSQVTVTADSPPMPRQDLSVAHGPPNPQEQRRPGQLHRSVPMLVTPDHPLTVTDDPETTDSEYQGDVIIGHYHPPRHQHVHFHSDTEVTQPQRSRPNIVRVSPHSISYA